ncbi:MAG TPA: hypothetical protein VF014_04620 [Casimicrobiaceae bacterium]|nr:hypothetical protein [Casimicrobiaceae bacterium]
MVAFSLHYERDAAKASLNSGLWARPGLEPIAGRDRDDESLPLRGAE